MVSRQTIIKAFFSLFAISNFNLISPPQIYAQQLQQPVQLPPSEEPGVKAPDKTREGEDKHIFGVLPNYRTAEMSAAGKPLPAKRKIQIAIRDSFDYPLIGTSALLAGLYQLEDSHHEFGQGVKGYLSRLGTSYTDQLTGNMLSEGVLPIVFREDPRYFRMSSGPKKVRLLYAVTRVLITRTDTGAKSFNFSEVLGNGIAAGVGLSYYPDSRNFPDYLGNLGVQIGTDAVSQIGKEFWPDIKRWFYLRHHS